LLVLVERVQLRLLLLTCLYRRVDSVLIPFGAVLSRLPVRPVRRPALNMNFRRCELKGFKWQKSYLREIAIRTDGLMVGVVLDQRGGDGASPLQWSHILSADAPLVLGRR